MIHRVRDRPSGIGIIQLFSCSAVAIVGQNDGSKNIAGVGVVGPFGNLHEIFNALGPFSTNPVANLLGHEALSVV